MTSWTSVATEDAIRRIKQATETCSVTLDMPIIGRVVMRSTDTRATEVCASTDALDRGDLTFGEYLAHALAAIPMTPEYEAWVASIPLDVVEAVHRATQRIVPVGHRCRDGGPHYRVTVEHVERPTWEPPYAHAVGDTRFVFVRGPGPS